MRFRLALFSSALAASLAVGTAAASADGGFGDKAVADDVPTFRLNPYTLEPGCYLAKDLADAHVDFGDTVKSAHIKVKPRADFSVDQALVPGKDSGYVVYNTFDTGTSSTDADIDPDQTGDEPRGRLAVTTSKKGDIDRLHLGPRGLGAERALRAGRRRRGRGHQPPDHPADDRRPRRVGDRAAQHLQARLRLQHRALVRPAHDRGRAAVHAGADRSAGLPEGCRRHLHARAREDARGAGRACGAYNDIDDFGELFADPHSEKSDHGQPEVFNVNGDPQAYLHNSVTAPDGIGRGPLGPADLHHPGRSADLVDRQGVAGARAVHA